VIIISIAEVYSQCARAIVRAGLWTSGDQSDGLPSIGQMMDEATHGQIDGKAYDAERAARPMTNLW
jgi:hypothetical protein